MCIAFLKKWFRTKSDKVHYCPQKRKFDTRRCHTLFQDTDNNYYQCNSFVEEHEVTCKKHLFYKKEKPDDLKLKYWIFNYRRLL